MCIQCVFNVHPMWIWCATCMQGLSNVYPMNINVQLEHQGPINWPRSRSWWSWNIFLVLISDFHSIEVHSPPDVILNSICSSQQSHQLLPMKYSRGLQDPNYTFAIFLAKTHRGKWGGKAQNNTSQNEKLGINF